jgi:hypothetical protein
LKIASGDLRHWLALIGLEKKLFPSKPIKASEGIAVNAKKDKRLRHNDFARTLTNPPFGTYSVSFCFFRIACTFLLLSFFGFLLGKSYAERKRSRTATFEDWKKIQNDCIIIKLKNYGT